MTQNCGTCRYWKEKQGNYLPDFGYCNAITMSYDKTEWSTDKSKRVLKEEHKNVKAFVEDGSDYYAALLCTKYFFCNMYEESL